MGFIKISWWCTGSPQNSWGNLSTCPGCPFSSPSKLSYLPHSSAGQKSEAPKQMISKEIRLSQALLVSLVSPLFSFSVAGCPIFSPPRSLSSYRLSFLFVHTFSSYPICVCVSVLFSCPTTFTTFLILLCHHLSCATHPVLSGQLLC